MAHTDTPVTVGSDEARQSAIRELSKSQYHKASSAPSPSPSTATPSPTPPAHPASANYGLTVALIIVAIFLLVVAVILLLRWLGRPRTAKKKKSESDKQTGVGGTGEEILTGAARHRRDAELAAAAGHWAEAIRERFRAVIGTLDERRLLPERADRTADEAARDAGAILPAHAEALAAAARAFDEVEYGEYVGTAAGYAVISQVDEFVRTEQPDTLQIPVETVPGGSP